jgi:hypothetical protein
MPTRKWIGRLAFGAVLAAAAGSGCKSLNERYIALEVWKYERCFGHLPPGFVPPGAQQPAAAAPRVCGQAAPCQNGCQGMPMGCNDCGEGGMSGGMVMSGGGMMMEGGMPAGATLPTPAGVTASKPVVISDELVVP